MINRKNHGPQLYVRWVFLYDATFPLKIPWAAKGLLSLCLNMKEIHINLYRSFSVNEIASALGLSYSTARRCQKTLADKGYVTMDGEINFDATPKTKIRNTRKG